MGLSIVILAAGKGKRMYSKQPKVLHTIGGKTLLEHVVNTARKISKNIYTVYGHGGEVVKKSLRTLPVEWVLQNERLGTGHAVLQALPNIDDKDQVLVLVGDSPLISEATLKKLIKTVAKNEVGLVTTEVEDPSGLGRILHDQTGKVLCIVEHRDTTPKQRLIKEINSGIIIAPANKLKTWLPTLKDNNAQKEYYLTDIIAIASNEGIPIHSVLAKSSEEVLGINDRLQQAKIERHYQKRIAEKIMLAGVTLMDPYRFDLRGELETDSDVCIDVNVVLEGQISIGSHTSIGPNCVLRDVRIGDNVQIKANTVIEDAVIENDCTIGPFARIRPGTHIKTKAKVGNFVEMKKATIGEASKVSHLSYIGDCELGKNVNVGAGTITCNYDGANKFKTTIEDDVFIGSNTALVAPVIIAKGATIGAGSTITKNTPEDQLTLTRAKQTTLPGWERPKKVDN